MMKTLSYFSVILFFTNIFLGIRYYERMTNPIMLTQDAINPSFRLLNTKMYMEEHAPDRVLHQMSKAIEKIEEIMVELDEESVRLVTPALEDLVEEYNIMLNTEPATWKFNETCVEMLLALAYAQVKTADIYLAKEGGLDEARVALRHGMQNLKSALIFSEGTKKDYEVTIFSEMNQIVKDRRLSHEEIRVKLDIVLDEIEDLEVSFFH